jgi:hypothetical protein
MKYDSTQETLAHIRRVQSLLADVQANLTKRAIAHDTSKLEEPEKSGFDKVTGALRGLTYGSDEYKAQLRELQPILRHHYAHNSHHPEHFGALECDLCFTKVPLDHDGQCPQCRNGGFTQTNDVGAMTLLDVIEMLCDWKAAGERHADGSITKSLEINKKRFGISDQLASILDNTRKELGWEG